MEYEMREKKIRNLDLNEKQRGKTPTGYKASAKILEQDAGCE